MKISIVGAGYVGLSTALGLAHHGHSCICIDRDEEKVNDINKGIPPFYEENIADSLKEALGKKLIFATADYTHAVQNSDITFICVGTPSKPDGSIDVSQIASAADAIAAAIKTKNAYHVICIKSTVLPGTAEEAAKIIERASGKRAGTDFGIAMNPEFLREGFALHDFMNPDRIVIGEFDKRSGDVIENLYADFGAPVMRTSLKTAAMIKYASNAFLATKVTFINELGNLCKKLGIDIYEVARGMGYDKRISPYFLNAGCGFGGSCFPKDISALTSLFREKNEPSYVLDAVMKANEIQKRKIIEILKTKINPAGKKIALLGLAFKENTGDVRDSIAIDTIRELRQLNAIIYAYDPLANENMKKIFPTVKYVSSIKEALEGADACLILTAWEEFSELADSDFSSMKNKIIIEGRCILDKAQVSGSEGVCW